MNKTSIEWTDYTWNPVTGCDKISQGCKFCYAEVMAKRFWKDRKFTDVEMHEERLLEPSEMKHKLIGKKVFVCDVSDLFHEKVTFDFIHAVMHEIDWLRETTFQLLTKRPDRALNYAGIHPFPPNVWLGTSCEDQKAADERIPLLLQIPAAVRFLSCEPLIGPIQLPTSNLQPPTSIHWVIAGGESGNKKGVRPMHPDWVRSLRDQCAAAGVPFFFKQWGEWIPAGQRENQPWKGLPMQLEGGKFSDRTVFKVGKSKSGAILDGKEHRAFPITQPITK